MHAIPRPLIFYVDAARVTFTCAPFINTETGPQRLPGLVLIYQKTRFPAKLPAQRMTTPHLQHFYDNYWFASEAQHAEAQANLERAGESPEIRNLTANLESSSVGSQCFSPAVNDFLSLRERSGFRGAFRPIEDILPGSPTLRAQKKKEKILASIEKNFGSVDKFFERVRQYVQSGVKGEGHDLIETILGKKIWELDIEPRKNEGEDLYHELAERVQLFKEGETKNQLPAAETSTSSSDKIDAFVEKLEKDLRGSSEPFADKNFRVYRHLDQKLTSAKRDLAVAENALSAPITIQLSAQEANRLTDIQAQTASLASLSYHHEPASGRRQFSFKHNKHDFNFCLEPGQLSLLQEYVRFIEPLMREWTEGTVHLSPCADPREQNYREAQMLDLLGRFKTRAKIIEERATLAQFESRKRKTSVMRAAAVEEQRQRTVTEQQKAEVQREMADLQSKVIASPPPSYRDDRNSGR